MGESSSAFHCQWYLLCGNFTMSFMSRVVESFALTRLCMRVASRQCSSNVPAFGYVQEVVDTKEENKAINSGAVHLKRSKMVQNAENGSQLAADFPKTDPHNMPELSVGICSVRKHVPKSKEAE